MKTKPRVFSGIKPSGELTLGNYLGMLKPALDAQGTKENVFCVVDFHAITVPQEPKELTQRSIDIAKLYLASGLDPKHSILFLQSDISAHAELGWILNCFTYFGEANRMTQFKDLYRNKKQNVTVGLFDYPILMAADILLYNTNDVPVGEDQKQHVELCRDLAVRMNKKFGKMFVVPKPEIISGARIMSLANPLEKMSKSDSEPNGYILMLDKPEVIKKKFKSAVTDSENVIKYDVKKKPGISNLLNILSLCTGTLIPDLEKRYDGANYGTLKEDVADAVIAALSPIQKKFNAISDAQVKKVLTAGAKKAAPIAAATLKRVKEKIGFLTF